MDRLGRAPAEHVAAAAGCSATDLDGITEALARVVERARAADAFAFDGDDAALAEQIAATLPDPPPASLVAYLDELHAADLALAVACARGVAAALVAFERRYGGVLREQAERVAGEHAAADDVAQQVRIRLLTGATPRIAQYAGRAPLDRWLAVAARRAAVDAHRARANEAARPARDQGLDVAIVGDDPELAHIRATCRDAFERAFGDAIAGLSSRDRNLLRQTLLHRVAVARLAEVHQVDRRTIARWLEHAREQVLREVCDALQRDLAIGPVEVASVLRLVASRLELGLSHVLRSGRDPE